MNKYCKIYLESLSKLAYTPESGQGPDLDEKYQNLAKLNTAVKQAPNSSPAISELASKAKPTVLPDSDKTRKLLGIPSNAKPGEGDLNDRAGYK